MTKADPAIQIIHEYFDNALGCMVKGKSHRNQLLKERGLYEIGNEKQAMYDLERKAMKERVNKDRKVDEEAIKRLKYMEDRV